MALQNAKKPFFTCTAFPSFHTDSQELISSLKLHKQLSSKVKIQFIDQIVETGRCKAIKEAVLFREISRVKIVLSLTYSNVYQNMCFLFQTKKTRVHKQKANETKENRKAKETKKVKEKKNNAVVNSSGRKSNRIR